MTSLQEATEREVNGYKFYIHPFGAFKAANLGGELIKLITPLLGSILPMVNTDDNDTAVMDTDVEKATNMIAGGLQSLTGDECERLLRELIIKNQNVAVMDDDKQVKWLTEDLVNKCFAGHAEGLYVLAARVVMVNYAGFFGTLGDRFGSVGELFKGTTKSKNTEN